MAALDAYSPCPCGSGQKFKWCCHKVEAFATRAEKQYENGQVGAALKALDEGLATAPDNPWLLVRKALILEREGRAKQARPLLESVLKAQPGHPGASALLVRMAVSSDGPVAGVAALQRALDHADPEQASAFRGAARLVGVVLSRTEHQAAALKHLELGGAADPDADPMLAAAMRMMEGDPQVSPYIKEPYELAQAPDDLSGAPAERFAEAMELVAQGRWSAAAVAFEALASAGIAPAARNLALCRLWTADEPGATRALRDYVARLGPTEETVDLEALAQAIAPPTRDDLVERLQLIWPVKDHDGLTKALKDDPRVAFEGTGPMDPADPNSFEVDQFALLDRPKFEGPAAVAPKLGDLPAVVGRVLVGSKIAALESLDDGRLDGLRERFVELAGPAIPPAHPKTKGVERVGKLGAALRVEWALPPELAPAELGRLRREEQIRSITTVWPDTPAPYLRGRTARQAARAGDAEVPLRAALCALEVSQPDLDAATIDALRAELGIPPEPAIDPATADPSLIHLARLHRVDPTGLDDDRLITLYIRSRMAMLTQALERAATALADRPSALERPEISRFAVFSDLASMAAARGDAAGAAAWLAQGRQGEPAARKGVDASRWDMMEIRLRARTEPPESWVPQLAVVLDRYRDDKQANESILSNLVEMGLVQIVQAPDRPDDMYVDPRALMALMAEYGPRVTTASGTLGVSATKPEIWTPGKAAGGGGGGIWTPGSAPAAPSAPPGGGSKLIVPGR